MSSGRVHILVIEDNPSDVHLVRMALKEACLDCELTCFEDGDSAIAYIQSADSSLPDAIILDVNLPKADGPDILNVLKATPRFSLVPVLALSSSSAPRDIARIAALGADCYLVKPLDLDEFLKIGEAVKDCIQKARAAKNAL